MTDELIEFTPGFDSMIKKLSPKLYAPALRWFYNQAGSFWRGELRKEAPRDQGTLQSSFQYNVDTKEVPEYVNVGTNARQGRPMNYGTGLLSIAPDSSRQRHKPPPGALQGWAIRHGFTDGPGTSVWSTAGGKVAGIIARRGGLRPREFMKKTARIVRRKLPQFAASAARMIEARWRK